MDIQDIAANTFTISALLMTASIVMLNYAWRKLRVLLNTMPADKRRVRFNLRSVSDRNENEKYGFIGAQFAACALLAVSLFGALIAVSVMSAVMVGDLAGLYAEENFQFAVVFMRAGVVLFLLGMLCSGLVYAEELFALYKGEPSIAMTKLDELPERPALGRVHNYLFGLLILGLCIILSLVEILIPYNQWVKLGVGILAVGILIASAHLVHYTYVKVRDMRHFTKSG